MPSLNRGKAVTIELRAGQTLQVSAGGTIEQLGGGIAYDFTGWPAVIGALTVDDVFVLNAITADVSYEVLQVPEFAASVTDAYATVADLPDAGRIGLLYATNEGLRYYYQPTGQYLALDGTPSVPVIDTAPVIAGEAEVDAVLTVTSNGVWDFRPTSFAYQWQVDGADVEGATSQTFVVPVEAEGLDITCLVTASNIVGDSDPEASNAIAIPSGE
jgi:hypothetical protein